MARELLLGVDVSTTGAKALLIDAAGAVAAQATCDVPLLTPRPGWAEQHPHDWIRAVADAIRQAVERAAAAPGDIRGIGLTGQMHGAALLDRAGRPLRPAILWNDQRTAEQCAELTRRIGAERVIALTGNPVLTGFTAPKLLWVAQHEPEIYARTCAVLLPKDMVRYWLSGERLSDVADASGTSLFDVAARRWSNEMLEAADVPRAWLPEVTESPEASARLSAAAAAEIGLPEGTPIVAGAGDQAAQAIGAGIIDDGGASCTLGTSGVVFAASDAFRLDPAGRLHAFCHAVPGKWHLMGVMLSAGGSLRWFRDALSEPELARAERQNRDPYELISELAATAPPGCEGLVFLPYLTGERTPHADPHARAAFIGLTLRHSRAHMARSVLEGVAFGLKDSLELMRGLGIRPPNIRLSGGGARSGLWRQILADVFGCPLDVAGASEGAAYGAALLAGVGVGIFHDVTDACRRTAPAGTTVRPSGLNYTSQYERFRSLYPATKGAPAERA